MAWDLLTNNYMIDSSRLYVTYFGGDEMLGLKPDLECREIWRSIGLADERILPFGAKDNFWDMGSTGPCGTCTEIHIDHLPNSNPKDRSRFVNAGRADLTELWNIVFIEYNRWVVSFPFGYIASIFTNRFLLLENLMALLTHCRVNALTLVWDSNDWLPFYKENRATTTQIYFYPSSIRLQRYLSNTLSIFFLLKCNESKQKLYLKMHPLKESKTPAYSGVFDEYDSKYELDFAYRLVADHTRMCSVCIADGMYPKQK